MKHIVLNMLVQLLIVLAPQKGLAQGELPSCGVWPPVVALQSNPILYVTLPGDYGRIEAYLQCGQDDLIPIYGPHWAHRSGRVLAFDLADSLNPDKTAKCKLFIKVRDRVICESHNKLSLVNSASPVKLFDAEIVTHGCIPGQVMELFGKGFSPLVMVYWISTLTGSVSARSARTQDHSRIVVGVPHNVYRSQGSEFLIYVRNEEEGYGYGAVLETPVTVPICFPPQPKRQYIVQHARQKWLVIEGEGLEAIVFSRLIQAGTNVKATAVWDEENPGGRLMVRLPSNVPVHYIGEVRFNSTSVGYILEIPLFDRIGLRSSPISSP